MKKIENIYSFSWTKSTRGFFSPITSDTNNNSEMCNCWWTNKKSYQVFFCFCSPTWRLWRHVNNFVSRGTWKKSRLKRYSKPWLRDCAAHCSLKLHIFIYHKTVILPSILCIKRESKYRSHIIPKPKAKEWISKTLTLNIRSCYITK